MYDVYSNKGINITFIHII